VHVWRLGEGSAFSVLEVPGSPVQKHRGSRDTHGTDTTMKID